MFVFIHHYHLISLSLLWMMTLYILKKIDARVSFIYSKMIRLLILLQFYLIKQLEYDNLSLKLSAMFAPQKKYVTDL